MEAVNEAGSPLDQYLADINIDEASSDAYFNDDPLPAPLKTEETTDDMPANGGPSERFRARAMDVLEGKCEQGHWLDDIVLAFVLGVERMRNSDRRLWIVGMALAAVVVLSKWELVGIAVLLILLAILVVSVVAERELLKSASIERATLSRISALCVAQERLDAALTRLMRTLRELNVVARGKLALPWTTTARQVILQAMRECKEVTSALCAHVQDDADSSLNDDDQLKACLARWHALVHVFWEQTFDGSWLDNVTDNRTFGRGLIGIASRAYALTNVYDRWAATLEQHYEDEFGRQGLVERAASTRAHPSRIPSTPLQRSMALVEHHARTIHLRLHAERQKSSSSQDVQPAAQEWQALGEEINMLAEQWSISNMFYTAAAQGKVPDMHSSMEVDADSLDIESSGSSVVPPLFTDNGQPLASADEPNLFEVDLATTEKEEDTAARRVIPTTRAERLELLQQRRAADAARKLERATSTQMMSELKYAIAGRLPASVEAAH